MSITKVKFSVTDDKGYRNGFIESILEDRFTGEGTDAIVYLTNALNNSEYSLLKVTGWSRIDKNTSDAGNIGQNDFHDAIALDVEWNDNSKISGVVYNIKVGDSLGIFADTYTKPGTQVSVNGTSYSDITAIAFEGGIASSDLGNGNLQLTV